jgi:hypothetical protein
LGTREWNFVFHWSGRGGGGGGISWPVELKKGSASWSYIFVKLSNKLGNAQGVLSSEQKVTPVERRFTFGEGKDTIRNVYSLKHRSMLWT